MRNRGYYRDLTGKIFGRLTVLDFSHKGSSGKSIWRAKCACGQERLVRGNCLTSGNTTSCGCEQKRLAREKNFRGVGPVIGGLSKRYWTRLEWNASARKHLVKITMEDAYKLFKQQGCKCALSGIPLVFGTNDASTTASLDRIDSSFGYEAGNVQWVHKIVNLMKNKLSTKDFLSWIEKIHSHQKQP